MSKPRYRISFNNTRMEWRCYTLVFNVNENRYVKHENCSNYYWVLDIKI